VPTPQPWAEVVIKYVDTRAASPEPLPFTEVVLKGIAPGGGLFVPERLPALDAVDLEALAGLPYWQRVAKVFHAFEPDIADDRVSAIAQQAYGKNFGHKDVAVLRDLGVDQFVLELWQGPTMHALVLLRSCGDFTQAGA
jgi:threonine synthase